MKTLLMALMMLLSSSAAYATCSNYTTYTDGSVLTAGSLNSLQTNYTDCVNNVLDGDTFTGNVVIHSGSDVLLYSDTGSTLKAAVYGDSGRIQGYQDKIGTYNLNIADATTTNAADSIKVECGNSACSATNPGFVVMNSAAAVGDLVVFTVTADVTINLTGAHWKNGGKGDLADAILRVIYADDNGTLRTCVALQGGRTAFVTSDTNATGTNIITAEGALCDTAVGSSTNTLLDWAWFKANFDDAGGAAADLWAVQTGVTDQNLGSADGQWQPWNPQYAGFSSVPASTTARFTMYGSKFCYEIVSGTGTSNSTSFELSWPIKPKNANVANAARVRDNTAFATNIGMLVTAADSLTATVAVDNSAPNWTASGSKEVRGSGCFESQP